jgi:hypothetical protein
MRNLIRFRRHSGHDRSAGDLRLVVSRAAIDPQAYLADLHARIVNAHPINRIDELLPWIWAANR